jgi:hypothetical protein
VNKLHNIDSGNPFSCVTTVQEADESNKNVEEQIIQSMIDNYLTSAASGKEIKT